MEVEDEGQCTLHNLHKTIHGVFNFRLLQTLLQHSHDICVMLLSSVYDVVLDYCYYADALLWDYKRICFQPSTKQFPYIM